MNKELIETEVKIASEKLPRKNTPNGPGCRLQAARQAANLSIEAIAEALHLTTQMVAALEHDDYTKFAGHTFIRGYLRNYARLMGLSPDDIIALFNNLELTEHESDKPKLALKTTYRRRSSSLLKWLPIIAIGVGLLLIGWFLVNRYDFAHSKLTGGIAKSNNTVSPQQKENSPENQTTGNVQRMVEVKPEQIIQHAQITPISIPKSEQGK